MQCFFGSYSLSLSLSHQQVEELEAILVEIQVLVQDEVHEVDQKVHEAFDEKEHQDHQRR